MDRKRFVIDQIVICQAIIGVCWMQLKLNQKTFSSWKQPPSVKLIPSNSHPEVNSRVFERTRKHIFCVVLMSNVLSEVCLCFMIWDWIDDASTFRIWAKGTHFSATGSLVSGNPWRSAMVFYRNDPNGWLFNTSSDKIIMIMIIVSMPTCSCTWDKLVGLAARFVQWTRTPGRAPRLNHLASLLSRERIYNIQIV